MARSILDALLEEPERMGARTQSRNTQLGTLANPGSASPLGPTLSMKTGAFLHPLLQAAKDKFPKDNPRGRWLGEMLLGDSPQRTGRVAEGIPDQYFHYNRGSGSNVSPQIVDLAAALPIGSAFKLAKAAIPVAKAAAVPAGMFAASRAVEPLLGISASTKIPNAAATSMDDIASALLGQSLQATGDLNKAMVGGDAGAAALARIGNTAPQQAMELAEQMESAGRSRDEIWTATADMGYPVFRGKDGKLRFEIDDSASGYHPAQVKEKHLARDSRLSDEAYDASLMAHWMQNDGISIGDAKARYIDTFGESPQSGAEAMAEDLPASMLKAMAAQLEGQKSTVQGNVSEFLDHPEMYQAYPGHGDMRLSIDKGEPWTYGSYRDGNISLAPEIAYGLEEGKSTALHELQHATQEAEGFARGGSPSEFRKELADLGVPEEDAADMADDMYHALAGEAEARQVQVRMDMTPTERALVPFYDEFDVPEAEQLVRYRRYRSRN